MSDQWGGSSRPSDGFGQQPGGHPGQPVQPPAPAGPQGPYSGSPLGGGPYDQPPHPYGPPVGQPQGPYGQAPQPGPYGPPQPMGPYGQPQAPITPDNPYGQPQMPFGQPGQPGQFPGGAPYGYPQPGTPGQGGIRANRKSLIVSGAVVLLVVAAVAIFFATKGSGSASGTKTQAESCASWRGEQGTLDGQNPTDAAGVVSVLNTDIPAMRGIADDAVSGSFKTEMQKTATDFGSLRSYLAANPDVDINAEDLPAPLNSLLDLLSTDVTALDSTCGISDSSGDGGF